MSLTPEEGAVLGRLADNAYGVTRFTPPARSRSDYRGFNADVVWPLEQLKRRGFVTITEREGADTGGPDTYWDAVAAALTPAGHEAVTGRSRDSGGQPGVPEG